jgi:hypothetical protein
MTAHDVRQMRLCPLCRRLGLARDMILLDGAHLHGFCAARELAPEQLLQLPAEERAKLRISDVGAEVMRRLLTED